jgi:sulfate/thiosulfate transport system substrate-binding protein
MRPGNQHRLMRLSASIILATAALAVCALAAGCSPAADPNTDTLKIGAYSVVREAFHDGLLPAFAAEWRRRTGRELLPEESYNASGAQARAIATGLDADIAVLSHTGDMDLLVEAKRVKPDWKDGPHKGIITHSLVVIGHRPGNPKAIRDWTDLARPGVSVLYPDPKTSGGARWNVSAIYGSALLASRRAHGGQADDREVRDLLARVQANVVNMDPSGRQSMANFERGTGDAVISYENELRLRRKVGQEIPYVIPPETLLIESPAAVVGSSVAQHGNRKVAEAFLEFLHSPEGQRIFADYGFRPVDPAAAGTGAEALPAGVFTIADLGGWNTLQESVYGPQGTWTSIFAAEAKGR